MITNENKLVSFWDNFNYYICVPFKFQGQIPKYSISSYSPYTITNATDYIIFLFFHNDNIGNMVYLS